MKSPRAALLAAALVVHALAGCGYRPLREALPARGGVAVVAGTTAVSDPLALPEAVLGAKMLLAREGALRDAGWPRFVVEVVRLDERSAGVLVTGGVPRARGSTLSLTGRAFVLHSPTAEPAFDTGDLTVADDVGADLDPRRDALGRDEAVRALARRLGQTLAARLFGYPTPAGERL